MNDAQRDKTLEMLANTLRATRQEVDGHRMVLQAALLTIATRPELHPAFKEAMALVREADAAVMLATPIPDVDLQEREAWVQRLTPVQLR